MRGGSWALIDDNTSQIVLNISTELPLYKGKFKDLKKDFTLPKKMILKKIN